MEITNIDILRRMQSRIVSKGMFNFDTMGARPLLSFLDYSDLDKLYNIASSTRYSGNIKKKLDAIREIMHRNGFRKLAQGTNRIVYSSFEDPTIVLKIATDKTGMKDNPREFLNQNMLKPFVTKVFEVTPDGVVGEFERVQPITSREEFLSSANEIYELLDIIFSKYIMADVGSKYFMNWGIATNRGSFAGPVLLDFSYLYEADINKLVCCAPNPNEPCGICGGLIDTDEGFNRLICTKCGVEYKAVELAKDIEENKIIRKGRSTKMKVALNWKGKKETKEINLDGQIGGNEIFKAPVNMIRPITSTEPVGKLKVAPVKFEKKVEVKEVAVTEEKVELVDKKEEKEVKVTAPVAEAETKNANDSIISKEVLDKAVKNANKNSGLKVKVTTQDGKTVEKTVDRSHGDETEQKSTMKVNDTPVRHYKNNHGASDLPRRSQVQLTAITFEQLKELDFKYSSTDLEFHKMFFRAEHEKSNPSISVDFDSIPKDKLMLICGIDETDSEELKAELEKTKSDLIQTEEALARLRKTGNDNSQGLAVANEKIVTLEKENSYLHQTIDSLNKQLWDLKVQLEEKEESVETETEEVEEEINDNQESENSFNSDSFTFVNGSFQFINEICEKLGIEVPENVPSNSVITVNGSDDFIRDQDGKVICIPWLNDYVLDDLVIATKQPVVGEGENTEE